MHPVLVQIEISLHENSEEPSVQCNYTKVYYIIYDIVFSVWN